jgi:pimeloyl-ACP methyl ester carboxylesterase
VAAIAAASAARDADTVEAVFRGAWGTDIGALAHAVRCPALVLNGALDLTCPPAAGAELAAALGVTPQVVSGVGHLAIYEHPQAIAELLIRHISRTEDDR